MFYRMNVQRGPQIVFYRLQNVRIDEAMFVSGHQAAHGVLRRPQVERRTARGGPTLLVKTTICFKIQSIAAGLLFSAASQLAARRARRAAAAEERRRDDEAIIHLSL
jgi:hypothetical protein